MKYSVANSEVSAVRKVPVAYVLIRVCVIGYKGLFVRVFGCIDG